MKKIIFSILFLCVSLSVSAKDINVLLMTGHTDKFHNWEVMSSAIKDILSEYKPFKVDVLTDYSDPKFGDYDVVIFNLNQVQWSDKVKTNFEQYMKSGGGLVVVHEADNAFASWKEYNLMIGLAGWGGRTEKDGDYYHFKDGKFITDSTPGKAGKHGKRVPFDIIVHETNHPIMKGLPQKWTHTNDELYGNLRGANFDNLVVLASGFSTKETGGTGKQEPLLMVNTYGKGRIFHSTLGHTMANFDKAVRGNRGFAVTLSRGVEWAATGSVKQKTTFKP